MTLRQAQGREVRPVVMVCGWCPDLRARELAILREQPRAVISHGSCEECAARMKEKYLRGEKA